MKKLALFLIITSVISLASQKMGYGQTPDLGAASGFTLFTAIGAFSNTGLSEITGDVGTNEGLFTGFPPGTVDGTIHVIDAVSANAAIDVNAAYIYLENLPSDSILESPIGSNQVLIPNVYKILTASTLTGTLFLDGQGDSNAQFIFQINGALTGSAYSNITPINSASLTNVYWQVNGEFKLGTEALFTGSVVCNGAINFLEFAIIQGQGLSVNGAINLITNKADMAIQPLVPLSVELLSFVANQDMEKIQLDWSTASESNSDSFTVQRSADGILFDDVTTVPGAGNSQAKLAYTAMDYNPYTGISYYRLKQSDFDHNSSFSNVVPVNFDKQVVFAIYPNPFSSYITITIDDISQLKDAELKIYDVLGKAVLIKTINEETTVLITDHLPTGIFNYQLISKTESIAKGKLICR